jgi:hypothetical protein
MLKKFHNGLMSLNNSKVFAGIIMILMNVGSKYITVKFSKSQEAYLRNYVGREILIFAVCWMGTKDIYMSIVLTASFFVLTQHLFNEESPYCVLPQRYRELHKLVDTDGDGEISQKEISEAVQILKKAKMQKTSVDRDKVYTYFTKNKV